MVRVYERALCDVYSQTAAGHKLFVSLLKDSDGDSRVFQMLRAAVSLLKLLEYLNTKYFSFKSWSNLIRRVETIHVQCERDIWLYMKLLKSCKWDTWEEECLSGRFVSYLRRAWRKLKHAPVRLGKRDPLHFKAEFQATGSSALHAFLEQCPGKDGMETSATEQDWSQICSKTMKKRAPTTREKLQTRL